VRVQILPKHAAGTCSQNMQQDKQTQIYVTIILDLFKQYFWVSLKLKAKVETDSNFGTETGFQ